MDNPSTLKFLTLPNRDLIGPFLLACLICGLGLFWSQAHSYRWGQHPKIHVGQRAVNDYQSGRFQEAEAGFRAATLIEPTRMELWYNLGNACFKLGKYTDALLAYERAKSLNRSDPDVQFNLRLVERILAEGQENFPPESPYPAKENYFRKFLEKTRRFIS